MAEMPDISPSAVDGLLSDTHRALERMRSVGQEGEEQVGNQPTGAESDKADDAPAPLRAEAEGADGRVRASVTTPGRLESLSLDPRLLKQGSEVVAAEVMAVTNAALEDLQRQALGAAQGPDLAEISGDLERIQTESMDSLRTMLSSLSTAMETITRRG